MAGRRARKSKDQKNQKSKKRTEFVSVKKMEPNQEEDASKGVVLHVESVCRRTILDQNLKDISLIPSGSADAVPKIDFFQDGVVYEISATLATGKVGVDSLPSCSDLEQAVALAFRKKFEKNKNKIKK